MCLALYSSIPTPFARFTQTHFHNNVRKLTTCLATSPSEVRICPQRKEQPQPATAAPCSIPSYVSSYNDFVDHTHALQPTEGEDLVDTFICNCSDCRKITASMFASNFIVNESAVEHTRGKDKLTKFAQSKTIATGNTMENHFCSVCGTLMYRISSGFPGKLIPRIGTVDDFSVQENQLKPRIEQFVKNRVNWLDGGKGVQQEQGNFYC